MNEMTQPDAIVGSPFRARYDNFIGGKFTPPVKINGLKINPATDPQFFVS